MKRVLIVLNTLIIILTFISCGRTENTKIEKERQKSKAATNIQPNAQQDLQFKLNEKIKLRDYVITMTNFIDNVPAPDEFFNPDKGKKFVAIEVLYENGTNDKRLSCSPFDWKLIDSDGYSYEMDIISAKEPCLHDRALNPGQKARGWITFQTQKSSKKFRLQFQPNRSSHENIEVQLY